MRSLGGGGRGTQSVSFLRSARVPGCRLPAEAAPVVFKAGDSKETHRERWTGGKEARAGNTKEKEGYSSKTRRRRFEATFTFCFTMQRAFKTDAGALMCVTCMTTCTRASHVCQTCSVVHQLMQCTNLVHCSWLVHYMSIIFKLS